VWRRCSMLDGYASAVAYQRPRAGLCAPALSTHSLFSHLPPIPASTIVSRLCARRTHSRLATATRPPPLPHISNIPAAPSPLSVLPLHPLLVCLAAQTSWHPTSPFLPRTELPLGCCAGHRTRVRSPMKKSALPSPRRSPPLAYQIVAQKSARARWSSLFARMRAVGVSRS
jgi:hypothetical protein